MADMVITATSISGKLTYENMLPYGTGGASLKTEIDKFVSDTTLGYTTKEFYSGVGGFVIKYADANGVFKGAAAVKLNYRASKGKNYAQYWAALSASEAQIKGDENLLEAIAGVGGSNSISDKDRTPVVKFKCSSSVDANFYVDIGISYTSCSSVDTIAEVTALGTWVNTVLLE